MRVGARQVPLQRAVDEVWGEGRDALVVEAEPLEEAGSEVLDQDVRLSDQASRYLLPGRPSRVHRDTALVPTVVGKEARGRPPEAAGAIAFDWLDLDHVSAEVGEDEAAARPHHQLAELDDPDPRE